MKFQKQAGKITWISILVIVVVFLLGIAVGGLYTIGQKNLQEDETTNISQEESASQDTTSQEEETQDSLAQPSDMASGTESVASQTPEQANAAENENTKKVDEKKFRAIGPTDHILGETSAPVQVIEYMDLDCPFCTQFHKTVIEVMQDYGNQGKVAWIYRHFPLTALHTQAKVKANATECVAEIGGNTYFWLFVNKIFENEESADELAKIAFELGVDRSRFEECMEQERYFDKIEADYQEARSVGAAGTPHSIVVVDGEVVQEIRGALPREVVQQILDSILKDVSGTKG